MKLLHPHHWITNKMYRSQGFQPLSAGLHIFQLFQFPKGSATQKCDSCPKSFSRALTWLPPALLPLPGTSPYIWYLHWHLCHQRWFQKEFCSLQSNEKLQNMCTQWPGVKKYTDNTESPIWAKIFGKETWRNWDFYFFSTVAPHSITGHQTKWGIKHVDKDRK